MSLQSPATRSHRPANLIDPQQQGEYPVLLGDALRSSSNHDSVFLNLRYNWKSRKPISKSGITLTERETDEGSKYYLKLEDPLHKDKRYTYLGHPRGPASGNEGNNDATTTSLALIYNTSKSAFILEPVSASLDFNITSAPELTRQEIKAYAQLDTSNPSSKVLSSEGKSPNPRSAAPSDSESEADATNPYDYRHFLAEAREATGKATPAGAGGSRTPNLGSYSPMPGAHTPLLGSVSPLPGTSRFHSNAGLTPQFHPTSGPSQVQTPKKRRVDPPTRTLQPKTQPIGRRKHATSSSSESKRPVLSAERITDSDDEIEPSVLVHVTSHSQPPSPPTASAARASNRNNLSNFTSNARPSSPHVLVSDADAELVIDMGSPPATPGRKKLGVDPSAFHRGGRNTPRIGGYTPDLRRVEEDGDVEMEDADVEELALGSPRVERTGEDEEDEDDEDDLAAELEAALEEDEDGDEEMELGLGITTGIGGAEEESEVSEEE